MVQTVDAEADRSGREDAPTEVGFGMELGNMIFGNSRGEPLPAELFSDRVC
jgi:hypothetical protein